MAPHTLFKNYLTTIDGQACYFAGLPGYPRNFSRDTLIAGIIAADHHLLDSQLAMSFLHQGKQFDTLTGEEPGKIHHEYPGVVVHPPYVSTYNACDTTALYLIGLELLRHLNNREAQEFRATHSESMERAVAYLQHHIKDDLFWEFPPKGAPHFSLHTTYWKDSIVPSATGKEEPAYPVAFALAHFQAARGLLAAGRLFERADYIDQADRLFRRGIAIFMRKDAFCVERDAAGQLEQPSSDELHALAYIPAEYVSQLPLAAISSRAKPLLTAAGVACTPQDISKHLDDTYHGYVVWIFEQALIHYGCKKFGLDELADVATRCVPHIKEGRELLAVEPRIQPRGNRHQLWSVAADIYFSDMPSLRGTTLL